MSEYYDNPEDQILSERTEKETDKKCPNCGATVTFDPASGMMHSDYCGYSCELPKPEDGNEIYEMDFEAALHTESFNWGEQKKSVQCKQCGAVTIYDALETAAVCPFCGSTSVMPAANENTIAPGAVCPFAVTKIKLANASPNGLRRNGSPRAKPRKAPRPKLSKACISPIGPTMHKPHPTSLLAPVTTER